MKTFTEFFPNWTESFGWTLLNSMWQALAIMLITILVLRFIPSRLSQLRYAIACGALTLLLFINISTFIYLLNEDKSVAEQTNFSLQNLSPEFISNVIPNSSLEQQLTNILQVIDANMPLIIVTWIIGAMAFSLRMLTGWWYISRLQSEAVILTNSWNDTLRSLARELKINRVIKLAQSSRIDTPVVMGLFKPIILVPVGMFSGLSTAQIETIFIHELAHIKRHDYLINLIQSFVEALFFFNPFIWVISNIIRREREYCCDDAVIIKHGSALAYAQALTQLEEVRLSKTGFALSLAENKSQLLNRIKRLMEKSVKNYSGKDRLLPALLLVIGLVCASWLSIRTENQAVIESRFTKEPIISDTLKKNKNSARHSKKTIITFDENGEPHEEVVELFEGSEELRPLMAFPDVVWEVPQIFAVPPAPSADFAMPAFPGVFEMGPLTAFNFDADAIPGNRFRWRSESEWKEFSQEFEKQFKEKFADFYKTHEKDFEKMMEEMEEKFQKSSDRHLYLEDLELNLEGQEKMLQELEKLNHLSHEEALEIEQHAMEAQQEAMEHLAEMGADRQRELELMQEQLIEKENLLSVSEGHLLEMEAKMKDFEKELKRELIKDGYINADDEVKNIQWDDDGIEVNGKKIKDADKAKYRKLHRKYFKEGHFQYVE